MNNRKKYRWVPGENPLVDDDHITDLILATVRSKPATFETVEQTYKCFVEHITAGELTVIRNEDV